MTKTFKFGKIDFLGIGRKTCPVEVTIRLDYGDRGYTFAASGTVWNHTHTDCYTAGQCLDDIAGYVKDKRFKEILRLWKNHHLNDMHAGTEKQEKALEGFQGNYSAKCEYLKSIGLYEDDGYKYGTAWLYRAIPADDLAKMKELLYAAD